MLYIGETGRSLCIILVCASKDGRSLCIKVCMFYIGETERYLRTRFGEHRHAVIGNDANQPVARHFNTGNTVFLIWKFELSVPFLVAMIAEMRLISINLALSTPMALMNVFLCLILSVFACQKHTLI
jgi:hypothetical protein